MKKNLIISLLIVLVNSFANAQITTYSSADNEEYAVFEVEDMYPDEIKTYNSWISDGLPENVALMYINAGRAQTNLINAPATIVDFHFDSGNQDVDGTVRLFVELINTSPKTIKDITFEFEFENYGSPVYDIKTGDRYLVLKYSNLKGRTKSDLYKDLVQGSLDTYHLLTYEKATYKKLFHNKKASAVLLHSVKIKYTDGTSSTKVAIFDNGYMNNESLLDNGPLSPLTRILDKNKKDREKEAETKKEEATPQSESEVFSSAARMPSYPGGNAALLKYLNDHMIYPSELKEEPIQGKVIVQFVVKKDGTIGEVKVSRGVHPLLDKEAIRLVLNLPSFSPGRNALGEPIDVWYTLPVTFKVPGF